MLDTKKFSEFPHAQHEHMNLLLTCFTICSSCSKMCLEEGHKESAALCQDCADVCSLAIQLHSRDSEFSDAIMLLCAEVCRRCSEVCSQMKAKHCQQCSDICKQCALACDNIDNK